MKTETELRLEINKIKVVIGKDRIRMAKVLKEMGMTNVNIAKVFGMSESTVRRLLK